MKMLRKTICLAIVILLLPAFACAQAGGGLTGQMQSLQDVLDQLYGQMIPLSGSLIGIGRGIAGFAALTYIGSRVWKNLGRAEPVDVYPLLRPFALGLAILMFPQMLGMINGLMQPLVHGTANMVHRSDAAIEMLLKHKNDALEKTNAWQMYVGISGEGDRDRWYQYTHPDAYGSGEGIFQGIGDDIKFAMAKAAYHFQNSIKEWMSEILQVLFQAAALCINTLRTFNLIILAILGPIVLGLSVFEGFSQTLTHWLARYINVFLWLPIANIFGAMIGKIEEQMLQIDLAQIAETGNTFFSPTDVAYLVFLIIAILGYFSVPSVASHVVWAGGGVMSRRMPALATALAGGFLANAAGRDAAPRGAVTVVTPPAASTGPAYGNYGESSLHAHGPP